MAKQVSTSDKKERTKKKSQKKTQERVSDKIAEEPKEPFDFGGLPRRDLKKNLGCG